MRGAPAAAGPVAPTTPEVRSPLSTHPEFATASRSRQALEIAGQLARLAKVRVVGLLLLAAYGGAVLGAGGRPGLADLALLALSGGLAAAGASVANQYLEAAMDARMSRTRDRPLASGRIRCRPGVLAGALVLIAVGVSLALPTRPVMGLFVLLGAFIYLVVYTTWLKPRTALNIVIGGGAGSCAVLAGGAAVDGWAAPAVLILAGLVFAWTPTHFWSLALAYRDDYRRAGVPMLPTSTSARTAALAASGHGLAAVVLGFLLTPYAGPTYLVLYCLGTSGLLRAMVQAIRHPARVTALGLFRAANLYLGALMLGLMLDGLLG